MSAVLQPIADQEPTEKVAIDRVLLIRAEGRLTELGPILLASLDSANRTLARWAQTAPREGAHKCDFEIHWADGTRYGGTYGLKDILVEVPDLREHVLRSLRFQTGAERPAWMTDEEHRAAMARVRPDQRERYERLLAHYDFEEPAPRSSLTRRGP